MKTQQTRRAAGNCAHVVALAVLVNLVLIAASMPIFAAESSKPIRLVAFGDSLTAGYMLKPTQSFPVQLAKALKGKGYTIEITNAGVSGDTTGDGLDRFDWAVPDGTEAVILELGANDALRGLDPKKTRANLEKIIDKLKAKNIDVLLAGMIAPKNWGPDYSNTFDVIYRDLASKNGLILYPFFLDKVALHSDLNLSDGMHPSAKGVGVIVEAILPSVEELIARVEARRRTASKS